MGTSNTDPRLRQRAPGWPTVVSAVSLAACLFLGAWCFLLQQQLQTEQVYRANTREKLIELLTVTKTNAQDEKLRRTAEEILREIQQDGR